MFDQTPYNIDVSQLPHCIIICKLCKCKNSLQDWDKRGHEKWRSYVSIFRTIKKEESLMKYFFCCPSCDKTLSLSPYSFIKPIQNNRSGVRFLRKK